MLRRLFRFLGWIERRKDDIWPFPFAGFEPRRDQIWRIEIDIARIVGVILFICAIFAFCYA